MYKADGGGPAANRPGGWLPGDVAAVLPGRLLHSVYLCPASAGSILADTKAEEGGELGEEGDRVHG